MLTSVAHRSGTRALKGLVREITSIESAGSSVAALLIMITLTGCSKGGNPISNPDTRTNSAVSDQSPASTTSDAQSADEAVRASVAAEQAHAEVRTLSASLTNTQPVYRLSTEDLALLAEAGALSETDRAALAPLIDD